MIPCHFRRRRRRQHKYFPLSSNVAWRLYRGFNAQYRQFDPLAYKVYGAPRGCVARNDYCLNTFLRQKLGASESKTLYFLLALIPIWCVFVVSIIDKAFIRKLLYGFSQKAYASKARIKYPNRLHTVSPSSLQTRAMALFHIMYAFSPVSV